MLFHGPETFAIRVADDSMEPRFGAGDHVYVDPDEPARDGRFVAVRDPESREPVVRLYCVEDGRRVLRALAPGWPERELTTDNETDLLGVAVFAGRGV